MEECIKKVRIADIKIIDRIRRDMGDLEELAGDIAKNGLINYPVVTPDNVLIAGERRVKACQLLGWEEIPVKVMTPRDYEHQLLLEISENENRKEFTFSERMEYAQRLERIRTAIARERSLSNLRQYQNMVAEVQNFAPREYQKMDPECQNSDTREEAETTGVKDLLSGGKTRNKIAELVGFGSGETYRKAKFIAEHADPETIRKLDAGEISIHRAYEEISAKLEAAEKAAKDAEARAESERRRAEELAVKLTEAQKALAKAEARSAEAERYKNEVENLRREIEKLKSRPPEVKEVVKEVVREIEKPVPDPGIVAEVKRLKEELSRKELEKAALEKEIQNLREERQNTGGAGAVDAEVEAKKEELARLEAQIAELEAKKRSMQNTLSREARTIVFVNFLNKLVAPLEKQEEVFDERLSGVVLTGAHRMRVRAVIGLLKRYIGKLEQALETYDAEVVTLDVTGRVIS